MRIIFNWVQYVAKCNIKVKTTAKYRHLIFFSSEQNIMIYFQMCVCVCVLCVRVVIALYKHILKAQKAYRHQITLQKQQHSDWSVNESWTIWIKCAWIYYT